MEQRLGSAEQARIYCTKLESRIGGPWSFGRLKIDEPVVSEQGRRTDLEALAAAIAMEGMKVDEAVPLNAKAVARYYKGLKFLEAYYVKIHTPKWRKIETVAIWGPTGTGKTRKAIEIAGEDFYILHKSNNKQLWFDGYVGQGTLIMDEFRGSWCPFEVMLRILDGHPYMPEQKGGHVWAAYTKIIITSNIDPRKWYSEHHVPDQSPLFRRISQIWYMPECIYADAVNVDVRFKSDNIVTAGSSAPIVIPDYTATTGGSTSSTSVGSISSTVTSHQPTPRFDDEDEHEFSDDWEGYQDSTDDEVVFRKRKH